MQQILGATKNRKNRVHCVYKDQAANKYKVLYGLELFGKAPIDHDCMEFKIMVAHLRILDFSYTELTNAFGVDRRTVIKWVEALQSGDPDLMIRIFAGQGYGRKLTENVVHFIKVWFPEIYEQDKYRYSSKIRKELKDYFDLEVTSATIRPLLSDLKKEFNAETQSEENVSKTQQAQETLDP